MLQFGQCPACGTRIPHHRMINNLVVCQCGWTSSPNSRSAERRRTDKIASTMVIITALLIGAFFQTIHWDRHFFAIIPLKVKQWTGAAGVEDLKSIAAICEERKKHLCVEEALQSVALRTPTDLATLERLGHLQLQIQHLVPAAKTFNTYFAQGGKSHAVAYDYAKVLQQLKKFDQANNYYRFALNAKPDVMHITITRSFIEMLMQQSRLKEARDLILSYRNRGSNTGFFMAKELKEIESRLGTNKVARF